MSEKGIYIVNCKETTIDADNELHVETSTCDEGYLTEEEAIRQCQALSDEVFSELTEVEQGEVFRDSSENGDWVYVSHNGDTYEYSVAKVYVRGL